MWGMGKSSKETHHYSALEHIFTDSLSSASFPLILTHSFMPFKKNSIYILIKFLYILHLYTSLSEHYSWFLKYGRAPLIIKYMLKTSNKSGFIGSEPINLPKISVDYVKITLDSKDSIWEVVQKTAQ